MASAEVPRRPREDNIALDTMASDGIVEPSKPAAMDTYNLFYTTSRTNTTLHTGYANSPAEYYFETKPTTTRKPQLYLRRGATKTSPTIGAAKVQWTSRHTLLARGDYETRQDEVTWSELHREKNAFRRSDYTISVKDKEGLQNKIALQWRKDRSKPLATVYDCVDENGTVVARLRSGGCFNWKKRGEIDVAGTMGETLKEWLLLSGLGIWIWEALDYQSLLRGYEKNKQEEKVQ